MWHKSFEGEEGWHSFLSFFYWGYTLSPTEANSVHTLDVGGSNVKQPTKTRVCDIGV